MTDSFSQSDDDLFNYDPVNDKSSQSSINSKNSNDFYNQISQTIETNDDDNFLELNGIRVKFSQAIIGSYNFWLQPSFDKAYSSSVTTVLDELTNGRFTTLYIYNTLSLNIVRRNQLIFLLSGTFDSSTGSYESFSNFITKLGVDPSSSYVPTYVGTLVKISLYIIQREKTMYAHLAKKLGIVPDPNILDNNSISSFTLSDLNETFVADSLDSNVETYNLGLLNNINANYIDALSSTDETHYEIRSI